MRRLVILAVAALLATAGCASWRAERARHGRLGKELDALRYTRPVDEVWLEVRRLLAERGFPLAAADATAIGLPDPGISGIFSAAKATRPTDAGVSRVFGAGGSGTPLGRMLETDWRSMERYRAEAVEDGGTRVILMRLVREGTEPGGRPSRDLDLELELARRVEPAAAERIEAAVGPAGR